MAKDAQGHGCRSDMIDHSEHVVLRRFLDRARALQGRMNEQMASTSTLGWSEKMRRLPGNYTN